MKNLEKASRLLGKEGRSLRQEGSRNEGMADIKAAIGVRPLQRFGQTKLNRVEPGMLQLCYSAAAPTDCSVGTH